MARAVQLNRLVPIVMTWLGSLTSVAALFSPYWITFGNGKVQEGLFAECITPPGLASNTCSWNGIYGSHASKVLVLVYQKYKASYLQKEVV